MDTNTAAVLVVIVLALIIIAAFVIYQGRGKVSLRGPFGAILKLFTSNDPSPAIRAEDIKSHKGGLNVEDETGRRMKVKGVEVESNNGWMT